MSGTKRKAAEELKGTAEKKTRPALEIRLAGNAQLWDVIDYLQKEIKRAAFKEGFWLNLSGILEVHNFGHLYVAYNGAELVGYVCFREQINEIVYFETVRAFRRQGVGRAMVQYCMKHADGKGKYIVLEDNPISDEARAFWERVGFAYDAERNEYRKAL